MHFEHHQRRASSVGARTADDHDAFAPEPGQVSRSAFLRRPDPALGIGRGPDARLAARAQGGGAPEATRELLEQVIAIVSSSGSGAPLPGALAGRMRAELGPSSAAAVDQARVHTDDAAAQAAYLIGAQAFTLGHHVYFGRGQFAPGTDHGDRLLRHELTHVAQHARGALASHGALELVAQSSAVEDEARAAEARPSPPAPAPRAPEASPDGPPPTRAATAGPATTAGPAREPSPAPAPTAAPPAGGSVARAPAPGAKAGEARATQGSPSVVVDLIGKGVFAPPPALAEAIAKAGPAGADVKVKLGSLTKPGVIRVKKVGSGYVTDEDRPQTVPLAHPLFAASGALQPVLRIRIGGASPNAISGHVALASAPSDARALQKALADAPERIGLRGFALQRFTLNNSLEDGTLTVGGPQPIPFTLGGWVHGQLHFGLVNSNVTFDATAHVRARGLQEGDLTLSRDARGGLKGSAVLGVALGDKFTGKATATYENGDVAVKGQVGYHSEKLNGTLNIIVADAAQAEQLVHQQIPPEALAANARDGKGGAPAKGGARAIAGWGDLDFTFTDWLTGNARVVYGPTGHLTVIGKIAPPKRVDLMTRKGITQTILPEFNLKAMYGIPYLAEVHIGIGVGLSATAGVGPIYMTDLVLDGVYSTDPRVLNRFSLTGALRAQADASLDLTVRGYAGLTLAAHSVDAGVKVVGSAGLRASAEAQTTLGYREIGAGKKGEYYLQGHLEMAAQPVLSLGGSLFVRVNGPFVDETWDWPIGSLEYPIPAQMGIGADVDYVVGSRKWPEVKFSQPSFDASKFIGSMMDNRLPTKSGRDKQEKKGSFTKIAPGRPTASKPAVPQKPVKAPKLSTSSATKRGAGMQTAQEKKNVPATKQSSDQWLAGVRALENLRKRAESNPEGAKDIQTHLAAIKAKHGFTQLTAKRNGAYWTVHAAMNPALDFKIKAKQEGAEQTDAKSEAKSKPTTGSSGKRKSTTEANHTAASSEDKVKRAEAAYAKKQRAKARGKAKYEAKDGDRATAATQPSVRKGFLGAYPAGNGQEFRGHFGAVPDPYSQTVWDWHHGTPYPSGPVTRHPANEFLGYQNHGDLDAIRPKEVPYTYIGGGTQGAIAGDKARWVAQLNAKLDRLKQQILAKQDTPTADDEKTAHASAEDRLLAWYQQSYPGIEDMSDLRLDGGKNSRRWQAHHVHEHSWNGHNSPYNFQYLPLAEQHQQFTTWWAKRHALIQKVLFETTPPTNTSPSNTPSSSTRGPSRKNSDK